MVSMTIRVPVDLLRRLDDEVARRASAMGMSTLNRSDVARTLLSRALTRLATGAAEREELL
jgi:hypothetical protein